MYTYILHGTNIYANVHSQHLERVGGFLELELAEQILRKVRGGDFGRIAWAGIITRDAVTIAARAVLGARRGGVAVEEVDGHKVARVGHHGGEDPCDGTAECG